MQLWKWFLLAALGVCSTGACSHQIPSAEVAATATMENGFAYAPIGLDVALIDGARLHTSPDEPRVQAQTLISIPPLGTEPTFDVATWNLLHFGAPDRGPRDEALQLARVRDVILGTDADVWAVQEVTDESAFRKLLGQLSGYEGVLSSDPDISGGSAYYNRREMKVGMIYKSSAVAIRSASLILTHLNHEFAGRPPLEVRARVTAGGTDFDAVFIILHAKAMPDSASWKRRRDASKGLEDHLAKHHSEAVAFVLGNFNDDIDESITPGRDTPYRNLLDAAPEWEIATMSLTEAGETSILGYDDMIDHILVSDDARAWYEEGSAQVYRVDDHIPRYKSTTSDHLPVVARFRGREPARPWR